MTDCEQQIYSNEYQDYLIEHTGDEALIKQWYETDCVQFASRRLAVIYQAATVEDVGSQKTSGTRIVWKWCIDRVC